MNTEGLRISTDIVVVDDEWVDLRADFLRSCGCDDVEQANNPEKARAAIERKIKQGRPFIAILDLYLERLDSTKTLEIIEWLRESGWVGNGQCGIMVMSSYATDQEKLDLFFNRGVGIVWDKIRASPVDLRIRLALLEREMSERREAARNPDLPDYVVGRSDGLLRAYHIATRVAGNDKSVVIYGATGTGKEALARYVHDTSPRRAKPYIVFPCAPTKGNPDLQYSDLFGHVRGSHSEAKEDRKGYLDAVRGGTLLLDDFQDLDLNVQLTFLRPMTDRTYLPRGGDPAKHTRTIDARFMITINEEPEKLIEGGLLLRQVYTRFTSGNEPATTGNRRIDLPPLCERGDDVLIAASRLARKYWGQTQLQSYDSHTPILSPDAKSHLRSLPLKGNFRELEQLVGTACDNADERGEYLLTKADFCTQQPAIEGSSSDDEPLRETSEARALIEAIRRSKTRKEAARRYGTSRATFYRDLRTHRHRPEVQQALTESEARSEE